MQKPEQGQRAWLHRGLPILTMASSRTALILDRPIGFLDQSLGDLLPQLRAPTLNRRRFKSLAEENFFLASWESQVADKRQALKIISHPGTALVRADYLLVLKLA